MRWRIKQTYLFSVNTKFHLDGVTSQYAKSKVFLINGFTEPPYSLSLSLDITRYVPSDIDDKTVES